MASCRTVFDEQPGDFFLQPPEVSLGGKHAFIQSLPRRISSVRSDPQIGIVIDLHIVKPVFFQKSKNPFVQIIPMPPASSYRGTGDVLL